MSDTIVTYKGRQYALKWRGPTKWGERCKLAFLDGSKKFWVPAAAVSPAGPPGEAAPKARRRGGTCAECGRGGPLVRDLEDGLMKHYNCCDIPP